MEIHFHLKEWIFNRWLLALYEDFLNLLRTICQQCSISQHPHRQVHGLSAISGSGSEILHPGRMGDGWEAE